MKGFVKVVSIAICVLAVGWTLLVLATAKVLGNAVFVAESDAYLALALNVAAIPALIVIMVSMRRAGTRRKEQVAALAAAQTARSGQPAPYGYAWPPPPGQPMAPQPGFQPQAAPQWDQHR